MPHRWDPDRYLTFADERGRPYVELLSRIGAESPRSIVDLGCGPGNLTALLAQRWPSATRIVGVDSSPEMIERAERDHPGPDWVVRDLRDHLAGEPEPVDVLISNATLQWVPGHIDLMPSLVRAIVPGGWLAFQVPGNFDEPSHRILRDLAAEESCAAHLADVAVPASHDAVDYLAALAACDCTVDAWETTYLHVLPGDDPVFDWVSGTGARPTLQALPEDLRPSFEEEFKARLRDAYPPGAAGVVLPFRRVFVVARRRARTDEVG